MVHGARHAARIAFLLILIHAPNSAGVRADGRRVPFMPDALRDAIRAEVDGNAALEMIRALSRFHRVHGSPGFAAAAELVRARAQAAGLAYARIDRLPSDGTTTYEHFRSYYGWSAESAALEEVSPRPRLMARFPDLPVALADYSQDADVTAELVDVGAGTEAEDYAGRTVRGRIVVASGALPVVHRMAVDERGAVGFLSDFPNQTTAWSGDDRDLVRWGHLDPYQTRNTFAFMLSKRQSQDLRTRLAAGERIQVRARVRAKMVPATLDVVTATIPGTDPSAGEIILTAHLCHQSAGANDNASGSAAIFEVGRALQTGIARGTLGRPKRTIRFIWTPEISGALAWLVRNPDTARRIVAGIHMDMVGGTLATTRGTFHLSRSAESLPHAINAVAQAFFDDVVRASSEHAETGTDPYAGLVWPGGSREVFLGDIRPVELGSDHQVYEDGSFGIPMVYFHDWPDVTIHTSKDQPENMDATKLGRVAYLGAGIAWTLAALPDEEAPRLLAVVRADGERRMVDAALSAELASNRRDALLVRREAALSGAGAVRSVEALWPSVAARVREIETRMTAGLEPVTAAEDSDRRVPVRNAQVRGPLAVYYYDHLSAALAKESSATDAPVPATALAQHANGEVLTYEALNLVNGSRSVDEIRDLLAGRYGPVPVRDVAEYLDLLARARVIEWR